MPQTESRGGFYVGVSDRRQKTNTHCFEKSDGEEEEGERVVRTTASLILRRGGNSNNNIVYFLFYCYNVVVSSLSAAVNFEACCCFESSCCPHEADYYNSLISSSVLCCCPSCRGRRPQQLDLVFFWGGSPNETNPSKNYFSFFSVSLVSLEDASLGLTSRAERRSRSLQKERKKKHSHSHTHISCSFSFHFSRAPICLRSLLQTASCRSNRRLKGRPQ